MRSRLDETHGQKMITYLRWASHAKYQGACGRQPLYGISEYIRVRPAGYEKLPQREHREHHLRHHNSDLLGDSPPLRRLEHRQQVEKVVDEGRRAGLFLSREAMIKYLLQDV